MTPYVVYDVFTDRAFGGNQLAVFPDATGLDPNQLQAIAREFNFSETTFVYPPKDPAHTALVRIFTPTMEVPFAGHPTIGTALALHALGDKDQMVLELGVGPIPCNINDGFASFTTSAALERLAQPPIDLVARALSLSTTQIKVTTHAPTQASLGLAFVVTELDTVTSLSNCMTDIAAFREGAKAYPSGIDFAQFVYVRDGDTLHARMFAPLDNIPEDPATGSASATLAALLHETLGTSQDLTITQGVDMGRPSRILARTAGDPVQVTISGQAVQTMKGHFLA